VLGVDDFSMRRGTRFATVLIDLERHEPIDVLATRDAEPLVEWLQAHPCVEVMVRDRGGAVEHARDHARVRTRLHQSARDTQRGRGEQVGCHVARVSQRTAPKEQMKRRLKPSSPEKGPAARRASTALRAVLHSLRSLRPFG
jgi:hypothetical protein